MVVKQGSSMYLQHLNGKIQHGAHGVVVSHPLRMRKALGSNPSVSIVRGSSAVGQCFIHRGHRTSARICRGPHTQNSPSPPYRTMSPAVWMWTAGKSGFLVRWVPVLFASLHHQFSKARGQESPDRSTWSMWWYGRTVATAHAHWGSSGGSS